MDDNATGTIQDAPHNPLVSVAAARFEYEHCRSRLIDPGETITYKQRALIFATRRVTEIARGAYFGKTPAIVEHARGTLVGFDLAAGTELPSWAELEVQVREASEQEETSVDGQT